MITSAVNNKYGVLRSFRPSSIVGSLEKSSVVTKSFESQIYSLQVGVIITI